MHYFDDNDLNWESMRSGLPDFSPADAMAYLLEAGDCDPVELFDSWTDDPFTPIKMPFGSFLEPEGFELIRHMKKPNTRSFRKRMPRTAFLARTIYDALPELEIWGRQTKGHEESWATITAGTWVPPTQYRRGFKAKAMSEWDILKMLAISDARSLANTDSKGDRFSKVHHIRLDIDLDKLFYNRKQGDETSLTILQAEIGLALEVFATFGLLV